MDGHLLLFYTELTGCRKKKRTALVFETILYIPSAEIKTVHNSYKPKTSSLNWLTCHLYTKRNAQISEETYLPIPISFSQLNLS